MFSLEVEIYFNPRPVSEFAVGGSIPVDVSHGMQGS